MSSSQDTPSEPRPSPPPAPASSSSSDSSPSDHQESHEESDSIPPPVEETSAGDSEAEEEEDGEEEADSDSDSDTDHPIIPRPPFCRHPWPKDEVCLLVISTNSHNYISMFENVSFSIPIPISPNENPNEEQEGEQEEQEEETNTDPTTPTTPTTKNIPLVVHQCSWNEISLSVYECTTYKPYGIVAELAAKKRSESLSNYPRQAYPRTIMPDIVMIRNVVYGAEGMDYRNLLFGFIYAGIPCVNSSESLYLFLERGNVHGELRRAKERMERQGLRFPLIPQHFHINGDSIVRPPFAEDEIEGEGVGVGVPGHPCIPKSQKTGETYPCVMKVSHVHAGLGKMMVENEESMEGLISVMKCHPHNYVTSEPFVTGDYELRLQKIGNHYRAMKKRLVSYWKSNAFGTAQVLECEVEAWHIQLMKECSKLFGGMDLFALDVLVDHDGKEFILEMNGTAIGLGSHHIPEDHRMLRKMVIEAIEERVLGIRPPPPSIEEEREEWLGMRDEYAEKIEALTTEKDALTAERASIVSEQKQIRIELRKIAAQQQEVERQKAERAERRNRKRRRKRRDDETGAPE